MTEQEIFTKVANHLLTQNEPSVNSDYECLYRGPNGLKCAVGCLIKDEFYSADIERMAVATCDVNARLISSGIIVDSHELLQALQQLHDYGDPATWRQGLERVATLHDLTMEGVA